MTPLFKPNPEDPRYIRYRPSEDGTDPGMPLGVRDAEALLERLTVSASEDTWWSPHAGAMADDLRNALEDGSR